MKRRITLSIPKACSEKWTNFKPTSAGGFCVSCNRNVVDFTNMKDDEILSFFNKADNRTCGRFHFNQLKDYASQDTYLPKINPGRRLFQVSVLGLLLAFVNRPSIAQPLYKAKIEVTKYKEYPVDTKVSAPANHIVKGIVSDEYGEVLPGVNIVLKGLVIGTSTDRDGKFEFPQKLAAGDILVFSFIGYKTQEYVIPNQQDSILEVQMNFHVEILGEVVIDDHYHHQQSGFVGWWQKVKNLF